MAGELWRCGNNHRTASSGAVFFVDSISGAGYVLVIETGDMKMASDFYWIKNGFFYNLIPNNPEAEKIWCQIAEVFSGCNIPLPAWPSVKTQITNAGYSVRKNRKMKHLTDNELEMLLSELEAAQ